MKTSTAFITALVLWDGQGYTANSMLTNAFQTPVTMATALTELPPITAGASLGTLVSTVAWV